MTRLRLLTIAILVLGLLGCGKKKDEPKKTLDPNAKITIQLTDAGLRAKGNYSKTREECLQRLTHIIGREEGVSNLWTYSIPEEMKDFDKLQVKMWGDAIIDPRDNTITKGFITSRDVVFVDAHTPEDTLGYIPNAVLETAYNKIKTAHEAGNYEEVYRLFLEAYTAIPCTGEEYRQLKAEGRN